MTTFSLIYFLFLLIFNYIAINLAQSQLHSDKFTTQDKISSSQQTKLKLTGGGPASTSGKESGLPFAYKAWNEKGKICILAKFEATFTINYRTKEGVQQIIERMPIDSSSKGSCGSLLDDTSLDISWRGGFTLRLVFKQYPEFNTWGIDKIYLVYNTGDSLFYRSISHANMKAVTKGSSLLHFSTQMGKSYLCPSPPAIHLYNKDEAQNVILRLTNVQLQAFDIKNGKFSPEKRCSEVAFGSGVAAPFYLQGQQDDAMLIVGTITIFVSVATVGFYAVYRSWFVKRVDYDTMA